MNLLRRFPIRLLFAATAILGAAAVTASADPTRYRLNGGTAKVGETERSTERMTMTGGGFSMSMGGQDMQGKMDMANDTVKVSKVISVDAGGKPTVIEIFYEKDASTQKITMAGQTIPQNHASPMQGVTVVRRREGNLWSETLKDGTPDAKQKKRLHSKRPDDDELYPKDEIAVGDTWTVPSEAMKRLFGDEVQAVDGQVRCKFLRVEEYAGETCAVIGVEMNATGTGTDESDNEMKMTLKLQGTVYRSIPRSSDVRSDMQGDMKIEGSANGATLTASGPIKITEETKVAQ